MADDGWGHLGQESDTMQADLSGIDDIFDEADNNDDEIGDACQP